MGEKWNKFKEEWGRPIITGVIASILVAIIAGGIGYANGKKAGKKSGEEAAKKQYYEDIERIQASFDTKVDEEAEKKSCEKKYEKETAAAREEGIQIGKKQGKTNGYKKAKLEYEELLEQQKEALTKSEEKQKEAAERFSYYLEFFGMYKNNAEELVKVSKELLTNPNSAKQEELNSKLKAMISLVCAESQSAGIFQEVLNGELQECAKKLQLEDAAAINHCLITLANTLPYKEKALIGRIYKMREKIPPAHKSLEYQRGTPGYSSGRSSGGYESR